MASSREERMQQRLRGGQKRQVKDVDFGLTFPAAVQQAAPSRKSPQPDLPPQVSNKQTPAQESRQLNHSTSPESKAIPFTHSVNDANTSAKRRKLDSDAAQLSSRSTRSSMPEPDIYTLTEDEPNTAIELAPEVDPITGTDSMVLETPRKSPRTRPIPVTSLEEDIARRQDDLSGVGQRSQDINDASGSAEIQTIPQDSSPVAAEELQESPIPRKKRKLGDAPPTSLAPPVRRSPRHVVSEVDSSHDNFDELPHQKASRRGQRSTMPIQEQSSDVEAAEPNENSTEGRELAEAISDQEAAARLGVNQGRRASRNVLATDQNELDDIATPNPTASKRPRGRPRKDSSPAKQKQPKGTNPKASRKAGKKSRTRGGTPIPVTVHRLTKRPVYKESESNVEILNLEIPNSKRGSVNAVDVLSQICQEIINSGLETLEDGGNNAEDPVLRREYQTKWRAVEAFGKELQTHLLAHTVNLDNTYALEKRVRDEQRKKLALREEILTIRAEREQVALRMDEIRAKHEKDMQDAQDLESLNNAVHDIELAIERGKAKQRHYSADSAVDDMTGIELLLKGISGEASKKGSAGGILKQIKDFNAFLERAALSLEARKT